VAGMILKGKGGGRGLFELLLWDFGELPPLLGVSTNFGLAKRGPDPSEGLRTRRGEGIRLAVVFLFSGSLILAAGVLVGESMTRKRRSLSAFVAVFLASGERDSLNLFSRPFSSSEMNGSSSSKSQREMSISRVILRTRESRRGDWKSPPSNASRLRLGVRGVEG
jgi:hypothetical protein